MRPLEDYAGGMAYEEPTYSPSYWSELPQEPYIYEEPVYNPPAYNPPAFVPYADEMPNALWEAPAYNRPTFEPYAFEEPNAAWEAPAINWNNPMAYNESASVLSRPRPSTQFVMPYEEPAYPGADPYEPDKNFDYFPGQRVIERPPLQGPTDWTSEDPADWTLDPEERRKLDRAYGVGTEDMFSPGQGIEDFLTSKVPQRMGSGGTDWNDLTFNELVTPEDRQSMFKNTLNWADMLDSTVPRGAQIGPSGLNEEQFDEQRRLSRLPPAPDYLSAAGQALGGGDFGTGPTAEEQGQWEFYDWLQQHGAEYRNASPEEQIQGYENYLSLHGGVAGKLMGAMTLFSYLRDEWAKPAYIQSINYLENPVQGQQEFKSLLQGDVSMDELHTRREELKTQYEAEMDAMGMFETPVRMFLDVFLDPLTYASLGLNKAMKGAEIAGAAARVELPAVEQILAAERAGITLTASQRAVATAAEAGRYIEPGVAEAAVAGSPGRFAFLGNRGALNLPASVAAEAAGHPLTGWQALVDESPRLLRELIDNGDLKTIIAFNVIGETVNQSGVLEGIDDPMMQTALNLGLTLAGTVGAVGILPPVLKNAYSIADGLSYAHIQTMYPQLFDPATANGSGMRAYKEAAGNIVMAGRIAAEFAVQYPGPALDALWKSVQDGTVSAARAMTVARDAAQMPGLEGEAGNLPIGINAAAQRELDLEQAALGETPQHIYGPSKQAAPAADVPAGYRIDKAGTLSPELLPARTDLPPRVEVPEAPRLTRVSEGVSEAAQLARAPKQYTAPVEASGVASVDIGGGNYAPAYIVRGADGAHHIQIGEEQFGQPFKKWQDAKTFLETQGGGNTTSLMKDATVLISGTGDVIIVHPYGKGATPSGFMIRVNGSELKPRFKTLGDALTGLPAAISVIDQPGFVKGDAATWRPADVPGINWKYSGGGRATTELPNGKKLTVWRPQDGKGWKMTIPGTYTGEKASTYRYMQEDDVMGAIRAAFGMAARDPSVRKQAMATDEFGMYAQGDEFGEVGTFYTENGGEVYIDPGAPVEMDLPGWGIAEDVGGEVVLKPFYAPLQVEIEAVLAELQGLAAGVSGTLGEVPPEYTELGFTPVPNHLGHHVYADETPTGRIYVNVWALADDALKGVVPPELDAEFAAFMAGGEGRHLTASDIFAREVIDVLAHEVAHYVEPHAPGANLPPYHPEFRAAMENIWKSVDDEAEASLYEQLSAAVSDDMLRQLADSHRAIEESGAFKGEGPDAQFNTAPGPGDTLARGNDAALLSPGARSGGAGATQGIGDVGRPLEEAVRGDREGVLGAAEQAGLPAVRGIDDRLAARTIDPGGSAAPRGLGIVTNPKQIIHTTPDGTPIRVTSDSFMGEAVGAWPEELTAIGIADADGKLLPFYGPLFDQLDVLARDVNDLGRAADLSGKAGSYLEPDEPINVGLTYQMGVYGRRGLDLDIMARTEEQVPIGEINLNPYTLLTRAEDVLQDAKRFRDDITDEHLSSYYAGEILMTLVHESAHATELHGKNAREYRNLRYQKGDKPFNQALADLWNQIDPDRQRAMIVAIRETLTPEAMAGIRTGRDGVYSPRRANAADVQAGRRNASEVLQPGAGEADAAGTGAGGLPAAGDIRLDQGAGAEGVPGLPAAGVRGTDVPIPAEQRLADLIREIIRGEQPATPERLATADTADRLRVEGGEVEAERLRRSIEGGRDENYVGALEREADLSEQRQRIPEGDQYGRLGSLVNDLDKIDDDVLQTRLVNLADAVQPSDLEPPVNPAQVNLVQQKLMDEFERRGLKPDIDTGLTRIGQEPGMPEGEVSRLQAVVTPRVMDNLKAALRSVPEGEAGSVSAVLASEAGLTAAAGGLGYITGDEDEDRNLRAAQFALVGAAGIPALKGLEYITGKVKKARIPEDAKAVPQLEPAPYGGAREWAEQYFGKDVVDKTWLEWTARNAEIGREARDVSEDIRKKSGNVLNTTYEHMRDWFNPMAKVPDEARRTVSAIEAQMATAFEGVANTLKGADAKGLTKSMSWRDRLDIFQAIEQPEKYMRLLTPEQKQVAQTLRTVFDMVGRAAVDAGIFSPEMVEKNPAYITHMWDYLGPDFDKVFKGSGGSEPRVRKAAPELKREWKTMEEAINSTDPANRLVLSADFDPVDIAAGYADVMYRRIAGERLKEWIELNHGGGDEAFVTEREWANLPASEQAKYQTFDADPLKQPRFSNTTQANLTAIRGLISKIDTGIRRAERWSGIYGDRARQLEQLAYDGDTRLAKQIDALATLDYTNPKEVQKWKDVLQVRKQELNSSLQLLGKAIEERKGARIGERDARDAFKVAENEMNKLDESAAALELKYSEQGIALAVAGGGEWRDDLAREIIQLTNSQTRIAEQMRTLAGRIATAEVVAGKLALETGVREDLGNLFDDAVGSLRRDVRTDISQVAETAKAVGRREAAPLTEKVNGRIEELTQRIQQLERMTMKERGKIPGLQDKVDNLRKWRDAARDLRDDLMVREQKETSPLLVRNDYQPIFERYKPGWEGTPILSSAKDAANSLSRTVLSGAVDLYMIGATAKTALGMGLTPGVRTVSTTGMGQALYHAAIAAVRPEHRAMLQEMNAPIRERLRAAGMGLGVDSHDIMRMVNGEESPTIPGRILPGKVGKGYESLTRWMEEAQFSGWIDTLKTMLGADVAARHMKNGMVEAEAWERAAKTMDMAFGGKNMRATGHKTATTDAMRFFLLAPNWFMTRGELFVDAVNPTSWRGSYGKQWAVQTAFMGGLASLLATAVYSAMEEDGPPDWGKVMAEWKRSTTDPRHFMEVKTPDGQFVSLLNWEKDIIRFPLFAYYAAQGDMDAANEALGPYAKARQNILPRLLYDLTINKNFAGKSIYDTPEGLADFKGIAKAAGQIAKSVGIEGQPQFLSEAEKVIPNKLLNKVLPGSPLDEDKTLGESMGQGRNTPQGVIQNMTGLGRARSLTPIQMAMQDDIEAGTVDASNRDYSRLSATEKKEFKLRHPELKDYFSSNLPDEYVDIIGRSDEILTENDKQLHDLKITVSDWKEVYGDQMIRRGTAGDYAFPDGSKPKNDQEREILNDWYAAFDAAKDERDKIDPEKLDALQQDFFEKWKEPGIDLVENYQLLGKSPEAELHTLIMRQLNKDGYWDMRSKSIDPEYRATTIPEKELRRAQLEIKNLAAQDPESQWLDAEDQLWTYGGKLGYKDDTIYDITLFGNEDAENPALKKYKEDHPGFMSWLTGELLLNGTIAKLQMQGFKVPQGLTAK